MKYPRNSTLLPLARELRKSMTKEERKLWYQCLRYAAPRFRRQEIIGNYIIDFFCYDAAFAVELDGSQHYDPEKLMQDQERTEYLNSLGITVLRFSNLDVLQNFEGVCQSITQESAACGHPISLHFPD